MKEKIDYQAVMEIAKIMFGKEKDVMKPISETISQMSMRNMLSDQVVSGFFGLFDKPHSTIADHSNHNYFSPSCKKCNHVMDNHVKYGNTDWHYCKTCLRYKKKSDCV